MIRLVVCCIAITLLASGCCCGPVGCETGCVDGGCGVGLNCATAGDHCYDCEGASIGSRTIPYGPLDHLRMARKRLVCGGGCGEVYYGEWRSTPPDACDPCQGGQFVGGAVPCRPFCWQPGMLLQAACGLYGGRFCDGCGSSFDDCCCEGGFVDSGVVAEGGSCGCASCNRNNQAGASRMARTPASNARQMPVRR